MAQDGDARREDVIKGEGKDGGGWRRRCSSGGEVGVVWRSVSGVAGGGGGTRSGDGSVVAVIMRRGWKGVIWARLYDDAVCHGGGGHER